MIHLYSQWNREPQNKVVFNERYLINHYDGSVGGYNTYEGIDIKTKHKIYAFIKQSKNNDTIKFRKDLNTKFPSNSAKFIWAGEERIGSSCYHTEIFHKLGPSVAKVIATVGTPPSSTCFLLVFNMLKLAQKLSELNFVYRNLSWSRVHLSSVPGHSNQLFFYEYLDVRRKGDTSPIGETLTSSINAHLGLPASLKDDFESICYMAFQLCCKTPLFDTSTITKNKGNHLLTKKTELNFQGNKAIPAEFVEMYLYIRNLPNNECPNYEYWKKRLRKFITPDTLKRPLSFIATSGLSITEDDRTFKTVKTVPEESNLVANEEEDDMDYQSSEEEIDEHDIDYDESAQHKISKIEVVKIKKLKDLKES